MRKLKIISHRGNINGPRSDQENEPSYIDAAIALGFDVEIDVRYVDGQFYLGHDNPDHAIDIEWFLARKNVLWVHCKNLDAAYQFIKLNLEVRCFCSISDPFCFMTQGYLWLNDVEVEPKDNCIVPLLNISDIKSYKFMYQPYGVCTDYPTEIK